MIIVHPQWHADTVGDLQIRAHFRGALIHIHIELGPYKSVLNIEVSSFQGCFNTYSGSVQKCPEYVILISGGDLNHFSYSFPLPFPLPFLLHSLIAGNKW